MRTTKLGIHLEEATRDWHLRFPFEHNDYCGDVQAKLCSVGKESAQLVGVSQQQGGVSKLAVFTWYLSMCFLLPCHSDAPSPCVDFARLCSRTCSARRASL